MRPFDSLTDRGKIRRLAPLARAAMADFPVDVARLRLLADDTNQLFRIDATDGTRYALRVANPHDLSEGQLAAEGRWLEFLAQADPGLGAPAPVRTRDGALWTKVGVPGVPQPRYCTLMTWVPGRPLGEHATPKQYVEVGAISARMHVAAEAFTVPDDFAPLVWDRVLYFAGDALVLFDASTDHLFTAEQRDVLRAAMARCQAGLDRAAAMTPHIVLHGDLHPWNVHRVRNRLHPLDFADLTLGPAVQDAAITLSYLTRRADHGDLAAAYRAGYGAVRPWIEPEPEMMDVLEKARWLNFVNYVARLIPDAHDSLPRRCAQIAEWMDGWRG